MRTLSDAQIAALRILAPGWQVADDRRSVFAKIQFKSFAETWAFMTEVAFAAEALDHHPEWMNVYNSVSITLTTHDADGLTERDFNLARSIYDALKSREYTTLPI